MVGNPLSGHITTSINTILIDVSTETYPVTIYQLDENDTWILLETYDNVEAPIIYTFNSAAIISVIQNTDNVIIVNGNYYLTFLQTIKDIVLSYNLKAISEITNVIIGNCNHFTIFYTLLIPFLGTNPYNGLDYNSSNDSNYLELAIASKRLNDYITKYNSIVKPVNFIHNADSI